MAEQKKDKNANDNKKSSDEKPLPYSGEGANNYRAGFYFYVSDINDHLYCHSN